MKKYLFIIIIIVVLVLLILVLIYYFAPPRMVYFSPTNLPLALPTTTSTFPLLIKPKVEVEVAPSPETVKQLENLEPGLMFWAKVNSIQDNKLQLEAMWFDFINNEFKKIPLTLTIEPQDEIIKYRKVNNQPLETIKGDLKDIQVDSFIQVSTLSGKKIIRVIQIPLPQTQ